MSQRAGFAGFFSVQQVKFRNRNRKRNITNVLFLNKETKCLFLQNIVSPVFWFRQFDLDTRQILIPPTFPFSGPWGGDRLGGGESRRDSSHSKSLWENIDTFTFFGFFFAGEVFNIFPNHLSLALPVRKLFLHNDAGLTPSSPCHQITRLVFMLQMLLWSRDVRGGVQETAVAVTVFGSIYETETCFHFPRRKIQPMATQQIKSMHGRYAQKFHGPIQRACPQNKAVLETLVNTIRQDLNWRTPGLNPWTPCKAPRRQMSQEKGGGAGQSSRLGGRLGCNRMGVVAEYIPRDLPPVPFSPSFF